MADASPTKPMITRKNAPSPSNLSINPLTGSSRVELSVSDCPLTSVLTPSRRHDAEPTQAPRAVTLLAITPLPVTSEAIAPAIQAVIITRKRAFTIIESSAIYQSPSKSHAEYQSAQADSPARLHPPESLCPHCRRLRNCL